MTLALQLVPSREFPSLAEIGAMEEDYLSLDYHELEERERENLERELEKTFSECSQANWDGYDAALVSIDSYSEAKTFLDDLPVLFPSPHIVPQPDGGITFEWSGEKT